jgi:hypothetical protein
MVNKVAVVIGATGSVGSAVVAELLSRGYEIDPTWMTNSRPDATRAASYERLPPKDVGWLVDGGCAAVSGATIDFDPAYLINRWPLK